MSTDGTGRQSPLSAFFATAAGDPADGAGCRHLRAAVPRAPEPARRPRRRRLHQRRGGRPRVQTADGAQHDGREGRSARAVAGARRVARRHAPGRSGPACGLPRSRAPGRPRLGHRRDRRSDRDNAERPKGPRRPGEGLPARPPPRGLRPRRLRPDPARQGQRDHPLRRRLAVASSSSSAAASPSTPRSGSTTPRWNTGAPSSVRGRPVDSSNPFPPFVGPDSA